VIEFVSPSTRALLKLEGEELVSATGEHFPILNGIPRFVSSANYAEAFGFQWNVYSQTQLDSYTGTTLSRERLERCLGVPLAALRRKTVLEAGCGAGRFTEHLVAVGAEVYSCDLSKAVDANKANIGDHPNYVVAQADILRLPFPERSFDFVVCLGVLQHLPSPEEGITALYAMVRPGGHLAVDHYRRDLRQQLGKLTRLSTLYRLVLKRIPPRTARRVIDRAVDVFFPLHWALREHRWAEILLNRVSPCPFYWRTFPELSRSQQLEWSHLDAFDTLMDFYKHKRSVRQIRCFLEGLGAEEIWCEKGGNGVEARCRRPSPSQ